MIIFAVSTGRISCTSERVKRDYTDDTLANQASMLEPRQIQHTVSY